MARRLHARHTRVRWVRGVHAVQRGARTRAREPGVLVPEEFAIASSFPGEEIAGCLSTGMIVSSRARERV